MRGSRPPDQACLRRMAIRSLEVETVAKLSEAQTPTISKGVSVSDNSVQQPSSGFTGLLLCSFLWGERMHGRTTVVASHTPMHVGCTRVQKRSRAVAHGRGPIGAPPPCMPAPV